MPSSFNKYLNQVTYEVQWPLYGILPQQGTRNSDMSFCFPRGTMTNQDDKPEVERQVIGNLPNLNLCNPLTNEE